ncbi:MAG TPA: ChbG/HpnK family deacetylase [Candidatus Binatia bacterium]|nr:ChbG/HpnK family deacetylase [Candidatus Binatia bacterium]
MKVIFHADDFGLTSAVNAGILEACERGVLRSTSLIVTAEAADDAVTGARSLPRLDVGVHLTLVEERPALPPAHIPSLVKDDRFWPTHAGIAARYALGRWRAAEARTELAAQLDRFVAFGLAPSHVDGHQHLHLLPGVYRFVVAEARRRGIRFVRTTLGDPLFGEGAGTRTLMLLAVRTAARVAGARRRLAPFTTIGFLHAGGGMTSARLLAFLDRIRRRTPDAIVEVMLHPGRRDDATARRYGHWRYRWENDLALVLDPSLPDALAQRGIEVTSFRDLATTDD